MKRVFFSLWRSIITNMRVFAVILVIVIPFLLYSNEWEIDTDGLIMAVITGYEISNDMKHPRTLNEYYDDEGRVLLKITLSDGEEYRREIFRYDNEGREIYHETWSCVRTPEWESGGYVNTTYFYEDENLVEVREGRQFKGKSIFYPDGNIKSTETIFFNKDGTEDIVFDEFVYEQMDNSFLRQKHLQDGNYIKTTDLLFDENQNLLESIAVIDDPDLKSEMLNRFNEDGKIIETIFHQIYRFIGYRFVNRNGEMIREELSVEEKKAIHFLKIIINYVYDDSGKLFSMRKISESDRGSSNEEYLKYDYFKQDAKGRYFRLE